MEWPEIINIDVYVRGLLQYINDTVIANAFTFGIVFHYLKKAAIKSPNTYDDSIINFLSKWITTIPGRMPWKPKE